MQGLLGYTDEPLVSHGLQGRRPLVHRRRAVDHGPGDRLLKVIAWYDNEWGYTCRVADLAAFMGERL